MSGYRPALIALACWAIHFFGAYTLMLVFPDKSWVGWATLALGMVCISGIAFVLRNSSGDRRMLLAIGLITGAAVAWQSTVGVF